MNTEGLGESLCVDLELCGILECLARLSGKKVLKHDDINIIIISTVQ